MSSLRVNFYAAASAAAGVESVDLDTVGSVGELKSALAARFPALPGQPAMADVVARSSFLIDGRATRDDDRDLTGVASVDVLPPFAGG